MVVHVLITKGAGVIISESKLCSTFYPMINSRKVTKPDSVS